MSLLDAVLATGPLPPDSAPQAQKKRYSEVLSGNLALEVAEGLRAVGFPNVKPARGGSGERAFQGGLGPKSETRRERAEPDYFLLLREIYNKRNPHAIIGDEDDDREEE